MKKILKTNKYFWVEHKFKVLQSKLAQADEWKIKRKFLALRFRHIVLRFMWSELSFLRRTVGEDYFFMISG